MQVGLRVAPVEHGREDGGEGEADEDQQRAADARVGFGEAVGVEDLVEEGGEGVEEADVDAEGDQDQPEAGVDGEGAQGGAEGRGFGGRGGGGRCWRARGDEEGREGGDGGLRGLLVGSGGGG